MWPVLREGKHESPPKKKYLLYQEYAAVKLTKERKKKR
jgi:hypothetical protein